MMAAYLPFQGVYEEDLDKLWTTSRFVLKQFDYWLPISMHDRNLELLVVLLNTCKKHLWKFGRIWKSCGNTCLAFWSHMS